MNTKKIIIIVISAILGVVAAVLAVLLVLKFTKNTFVENISHLSSANSSISSSIPVIAEPIEINLTLSAPQSQNITVTQNSYTFVGTSDPEAPLTLNGSDVLRNEDGSFNTTVELNIGANTFTFIHKDQQLTYTINYRYVVIESHYPSASTAFSGGSPMEVSVNARAGSNVSATFYGQTLNLIPDSTQSGSFIKYTATFSIPQNESLYDVNLGKVTFYGVCDGISESFSSGNIIGKKPDYIVDSDPNYNLSGGRYTDVGAGKITEIIAYEAETFDAYSTNDLSKPYNNYLPKGTVDYSAQNYVYHKNSSETREYTVLRCGMQVYTYKRNKPLKENLQIVKEYAGILPDHNEIGIVSLENGSSHSTLTLDTMWKAPFYFNLYPLSYNGTSAKDFSVSSQSYHYLDITFCYATVLTGEITIPTDNPIFSRAEIIQNASDYTLRLHLKKTGGFYGWDANYNAAGQLVFEFLNPAKITAATNEYGYDLTGTRILIDVGHGGIDPGAVSFSAVNTEAAQNLLLGYKIKAELESIGATVYMTRTDNSTSTCDDKLTMIKRLKPDFCIAVHHNSSTSSRTNGFDSYYTHPFARNAADYIHYYTNQTGIYSKSGLGWHYYFMSRSSVCPVVLTENGYMSNWTDYTSIVDDNLNTQKAKAITKGIVYYFYSIQ